jgi:hypothetical protein
MKHVGRHRKNPLQRDLDGDWDDVVIFVSDPNPRWIRYLDRNGEVKDDVIQK